MAALSASECGADVVLVDRDLSGAGHTANTLFEGMREASGIKLDGSFLKHELEGMMIVAPSGRAARIPARGFFIDRSKFDEHHLALAKSAGVELLSGSVESAELAGSRRKVILSGCDAAERIDARVVIDASGIRSGLAESVGIRPMLHPEDIAWAMEADVEFPGIGEEKLFSYWIGSISPGWKATFSPAGGDRATLGVFVRGHGDNVQPFFRGFLNRFKATMSRQYPDIESMKILSIRRGGDPIAVLPGEITADSFMVTGGAAAQSGLAYGMRAGSICGMVAAQASAERDVSRRRLKEYVRLWRRQFYWQYRMGRASLLTLSDMKDSEIDRLVQGLSGKRLLSGGHLLQKMAFSGAKVMLASPMSILKLASNLIRG